MNKQRLAAFLLGWLSVSGCSRPNTTPKPPPVSAPAVTQAAGPTVEAFRAQRPAPTAPGHFEFPTPQVSKLENGLSVYSVRRRTHVVSLSIIVRHGASALPGGKSGLAGLTARMLSEGTRRKSAVRLAEAVESLGATLLTDAARDESSLGLTVLADDVGKALALLAEVVSQPSFPAREFDRVRAEWLDGLRAERQEPQRLAVLAALRALHGPVLGAPVSGTIADVERLTLADLSAFHQRAYTPDSAALIVVGDLDPESLLKEANLHFRAWQGKGKVTSPPDGSATAPERTRVLLVDRPSAVQSAIAVVQKFPKRADPGHEVRQVLGRILGGLFTSRLNTNLREKHAYTYGVSASPAANRTAGALLAATSVRTDVTGAALSQITRELELLRDPALGTPISPEELVRAKADLVFSLGAALEHPSRVADSIGEQFVYELPADYHTRYPALIHAIPRDAVADAAQAITPDRLIMVVVGDGQSIRPQLTRLGFSVESAPPSLLD